ncbi:GM15389 [Drosophila sechellia]|uniref:GM15389 n=1 Tax=Drosophila sechellia TaxID=7238 RepID=B4IBM9_DROSE|nr:GM15389 [Drosophila sechellia]
MLVGSAGLVRTGNPATATTAQCYGYGCGHHGGVGTEESLDKAPSPPPLETESSLLASPPPWTPTPLVLRPSSF